MSLIIAMASIGTIRVSISDLTVSDVRSGVTATTTYTLTNAGAITSATTLGGTVAQGNWITPTTAAGAAYEVFVSNSGDALTSGTTGSWLPLNVTQAWSISKAGPIGFVQADLLVQIRRASDLVVLDTANITLYSEKN